MESLHRGVVLEAVGWKLLKRLTIGLELLHQVHDDAADPLRLVLDEPVYMPLVMDDHAAVDNRRWVISLRGVNPLVEQGCSTFFDRWHSVKLQIVSEVLGGYPVPVNLPADLARLC